jgi:hypothetical protein
MTPRVSLLFSLLPTSLAFLTLTSSVITPLFLNRSIEMATDIGSLAAGLDGHVDRLRIGRNGLRKNGESLPIYLGVLPFHCRFSLPSYQQKCTTLLPNDFPNYHWCFYSTGRLYPSLFA